MTRRTRRPVVVLTALAMVPAVAFGALWVYADGRSTDNSSAPTTTIAAVLPPALATPLLSVRRSPAVLASDRRADVLIAAAAPLRDSIDGSSCVAVGLNDEVLLSSNPDVVVIPASNLKLVVAAMAIDVLGPGATFTTNVVGPAPAGGVIDGDVYLVGGGDPVLSEQWYTQPSSTRKRPPVHTTSIESLADALVAAGITRISGQVLGDGSRYDTEAYPPGWGNDIRATPDGTPVGALVINDSLSTSGAQSSQPAQSASAAFTRLLSDRGITVEDGSEVGVATTGQAVLASVQSAPLTDLVNEMLATSDNLTAEMFVKEIGLAVTGRGSRIDGLQAITDRLITWGVPTAGVVLTDGSGLSRDNQFTCTALMAVLQRGSATDAVGAGLARGGQDGSTLADLFEQSGLAGVVQGKTGSLTGVKSLSGYFVVGEDEVEFVLILNGNAAGSFTALWDQLGAALLTTASAPTAAAVAAYP